MPFEILEHLPEEIVSTFDRPEGECPEGRVRWSGLLPVPGVGERVQLRAKHQGLRVGSGTVIGYIVEDGWLYCALRPERTPRALRTVRGVPPGVIAVAGADLLPQTEEGLERIRKHMPGGLPKWIACYVLGWEWQDKGGGFLIAFTRRGAVGNPYLMVRPADAPNGWQHEYKGGRSSRINLRYFGLIGGRVRFDALPRYVRLLAMRYYRGLWKL